MSFLEIEKGKFGGLETVSNRVAVANYSNCTKIGVSGDIYKKLGSPTYFKLMLGTGAHSGFIALIPRNMPSASSFKIHGNNKSTNEIAVSPKKIGITNDKRALTPVPFEITEDGLVIDIRPLRTPTLAVAAE